MESATDPTEYLPTLTTVEATAWVTNVISIKLEFSARARELYKQHNPRVRVSLLLNGDPSSSLGPGTFLDRSATLVTRKPTWQAETTFPNEQFPDMESRFFDLRHEWRYGVILDHMNAIGNGAYTIYWRTPPGDAAKDNATLTYSIAGARCFIDYVPFTPTYSLNRIPGTQSLTPSDFDACERAWIYLPLIHY